MASDDVENNSLFCCFVFEVWQYTIYQQTRVGNKKLRASLHKNLFVLKFRVFYQMASEDIENNVVA